MPRRKPTDKDPGWTSDKRGGYTGGADAASVPPPERLPSAYQPVNEARRRQGLIQP
jgi:hypothetical protein